ncbi:hypothetical protein LL037_08395 [Clostridium estertheticum]|uniref:hypothetical protein n=1 Tax=Clostridium estertheticum TaxID=238834 RepID=UPI001C0CBB29|nr:hypothetical protein [Clostridium estertheticum]MBU3201737.1 hypothetical protein [Clostridium estertheticum]WAG67133.1 hypothetical protein LL037_08395 [Clostridium estertheticum]
MVISTVILSNTLLYDEYMLMFSEFKGADNIPIIGDYFTVELQPVHLNWGTVSTTGSRHRHPDEAYIPVSVADALRLNLLNNGTLFNVSGQGFSVKVTGTQSNYPQYGKNLSSSHNLRLLGAYLKRSLNAQPGDTIRVEWISNMDVEISII